MLSEGFIDSIYGANAFPRPSSQGLLSFQDWTLSLNDHHLTDVDFDDEWGTWDDSDNTDHQKEEAYGDIMSTLETPDKVLHRLYNIMTYSFQRLQIQVNNCFVTFIMGHAYCRCILDIESVVSGTSKSPNVSSGALLFLTFLMHMLKKQTNRILVLILF
ncbi:hypothetical protein ACJX0J_037703 [Zea mays]